MIDKNLLLAEALLKDYTTLKSVIDKMKTDGWKNPNNYWVKILNNIMHKGSNAATLMKRMQYSSYKTAEIFEQICTLSKDEQIKLFSEFVPGSRNMTKERKIDLLLRIIERILDNGGLENCFIETTDREKLLTILTQFNGIGCKIARNVYMDLYHPVFRDGTIPIDLNWIKIGEYLNYKWDNPCKDENKILTWRKAYIKKEIISEDWEFDRLVYQCLQKTNSNFKKLIDL